MNLLDTTLKESVSSFVHRLCSKGNIQLVTILLLLGSLSISHKVVAQAGTISDNAITLNARPTTQSSASSNNYAGSQNNSPYTNYQALARSSSTAIPTPALGTYDLNGNSSLTLTAAMLMGTITTSATNLSATRVQYRVYLTGTTDALKPSYTNLTLASSLAPTSDPTISTFTGTNNGLAENLLNGLVNGGTYVLDVRFQADIDKNGSSITLTDLQGGDYFFANFYVTPPPVTPPGGITTWQGVARGANGRVLTSDTEWSNTNNWSNGVPNATSNAILPPKSDASTVYPILNDATYNYAVNDLTLQGNSGSTAAQLVINVATLSIYGNLRQPGGGLAGNITNSNPGVADATKNSTVIFAGGNQIITGQLLVSDIVIAGTGVKSVINTIIPANIIVFRPTSVSNGVIVQSAAQEVGSGPVTTVFDTTGNSFISLVATSSISLVPGEAETNSSYIKGVTRSDRRLLANTPNSFGNIGIELTANHTPGSLFIYRVVGDPLSGPVSTRAVPVKRYFKLIGDDDSRSAVTAGSTLDVVFHYLNSADELNGIQESNLAMFRSEVNGAPYTALGGTLDIVAKTVTSLTLPSLSTSYITLGDKTNPLPISLTAFTATRSNANTALAWTTASELNNSGFEVQVSGDGATFRKLAFVASQNPNSNQALNYSYLDTESGKFGTRYYRLRQIDISGEEAFSPVRAVSFSGSALASTGLAAYPNPFVDKLDFNLDATAVGTGLARVQLVDMTGRMVREQSVSVANASLSLGDLASLRSGLYLAKVTLPDGTSQTVRIQKQ